MVTPKWVQEPQITIISIFASLFLFPIILILLVPIFIIRYVVLLLSRVFKPEFREMLSGYSTLLAVNDIYTKPNCTGVSTLMIDNELNLVEIQRVGNLILSNEKFVKATQTIAFWMGFVFWKHNPDFSLSNQLIVYKEPINNAELEEIKERLLKEPFSKTKPLWELHIFPNYTLPSLKNEKTCTVVLVRVHHCLLDWNSMMDLIKEINKCLTPSGHTLKPQINNKPRKERIPSTSEKLMMTYLVLKHLVFGPYESIKSLIISISTTLGKCIPKEPQKEHFSWETIIPIEHVKHVANINGVKTAAVTFAAMSGALRQLMIDLNVQPLPEMVPVCIPVPLPGPRPKGLCNYFSSIPIYAPVGLQDPFERLKHIQKQFDRAQYSTIVYGHYFVFQLLGGLFHWMAKFFFQMPMKSAAATLAPGPSDMNSLLGINLISYGFSGAMPYGDVVIFGFYSFSVNGSMYLRVTGDEMLFPDGEAAQRFIGLIQKEIEILNWDADNGNRTDGQEYNYNLQSHLLRV